MLEKLQTVLVSLGMLQSRMPPSPFFYLPLLRRDWQIASSSASLLSIFFSSCLLWIHLPRKKETDTTKRGKNIKKGPNMGKGPSNILQCHEARLLKLSMNCYVKKSTRWRFSSVQNSLGKHPFTWISQAMYSERRPPSSSSYFSIFSTSWPHSLPPLFLFFVRGRSESEVKANGALLLLLLFVKGGKWTWDQLQRRRKSF